MKEIETLMFEREDAFFRAHQAEFEQKYPHKQMIIVGETVWGVFDTPEEAAAAAMERLESETYLIRWSDDKCKEITFGPVISYA
jgi:hypothetical protein